MAEDAVKWHEILQHILDRHLPLLSGKRIREGQRERSTYFQIDYFCEVEGDLPEARQKPIVRPFDHLKSRNIIEYKSIHESLNESLFRHYVSRALFLENPEPRISFRNQLTLTVLVTKKPEALFAVPD